MDARVFPRSVYICAVLLVRKAEITHEAFSISYQSQPSTPNVLILGTMPHVNEVSRRAMTDGLSSCGVEISFDGMQGDFWPHGSIDAIITHDAVSRLWQTTEKNDQELHNFVTSVIKDSKLVLATVLSLNFDSKESRQAIDRFQRFQLNDSRLPFDSEHFGPKPGTYDHPWNTWAVKLFCKTQWGFLAPVFGRNQNELKLNKNIPLPFTETNLDAGSGHFSDVREVIIHDAHRKNTNIPVRQSTSYPDIVGPRSLS